MAAPDPDRTRLVGIAMGLGPMFVAAIVLGYFGGSWLDRRLGIAPWGLLAGLALGMAAGVAEVVRLVRALGQAEHNRREAKVARAQAAKRASEGAGAGTNPATASDRDNLPHSGAGDLPLK